MLLDSSPQECLAAANGRTDNSGEETQLLEESYGCVMIKTGYYQTNISTKTLRRRRESVDFGASHFPHVRKYSKVHERF